MKKSKSQTIFFTSILYICGFILFLEWLYPLQMFSTSLPLYVIIIYAIFCFAISLLRMRGWMTWLLKGFGLVFVIDQLFLQAPIFRQGWFTELFSEISFNSQVFMDYEWSHFTVMFRMLMILLLIWLMSYLIYYWFVTLRRIYLFVLLTFVFITVVDTFTIYDGTYAIMRTFIIALLSFGIVNFLHVKAQEFVSSLSYRRVFAWFAPAVLLVFLAATIGYAAPKYSPQWPDPLPFLKNQVFLGEEEIGRSGYRVDDSELGGSFEWDHTPVFRAATTKRNYWRVETKDVYTGKGWEQSSERTSQALDDGLMPFRHIHGNVPTEKLSTTIKYEADISLRKLVYPYGTTYLESENEAILLANFHTESLEKMSNESLASDVIEIDYFSSLYDQKMLQNTSEEDPESVRSQYTQVPETLPERVSVLAEDITAADDNRYDQAKSVEKYFADSGFTYQTSSISYPDPEQDYVDQFLFDTKRGYCDNYSTSMVMILRTLDIPARWVKGFTGGQKLDHTVEYPDGSYDIYEVTNANAHSWVEVFFPDIGWVPFEPTLGFQNNQRIPESSEETEENDEILEEPAEEEEKDEQNLSIPENVEGAPTDAATKTEDHLFSSYWIWVTLSLLIIAMGLVIYRLRFRLKTASVKREFLRKKDVKTFVKAYQYLLQLLHRHGLKRSLHQTLREYARIVDEHYETDEMQQLTDYYEKLLYAGEEGSTDQSINTWESFVDRITAKSDRE